MSVGHDNGVEGAVIEGHRGFIKETNVGVAHLFKFCNALCLFCDCLVYNVLLHGGEAVGKEGTSFIMRLVVHLKALLHRVL